MTNTTSAPTVPSPEVIWLSHALSPATQAYGGGEGLTVRTLSSIRSGDTANTTHVTFPNHLGTHVDVPAHFFDGAPDTSSYGPSDWIFRCPLVLDVEIASGELVTPGHVEGRVDPNTDLLLIRTGHERTRGTPAFWEGGPGLSSELGHWLRNACPSVRAVGVDLISVTTRLRREEGRAAHRAFLDPRAAGTALRLIEDMKLGHCPRDLDWVLVSPLALEAADGTPATVWAFPDSTRNR